MDCELTKALFKEIRVSPSDLARNFRPTAIMLPTIDCMIYLEKDCPYLARPVEGSNISILYDGDKIVGVKIQGFSDAMK